MGGWADGRIGVRAWDLEGGAEAAVELDLARDMVVDPRERRLVQAIRGDLRLEPHAERQDSPAPRCGP
jgi:hypothetical protein